MARILIVDDSPSQLMGMKRIVEKLGHEALTAEDFVWIRWKDGKLQKDKLGWEWGPKPKEFFASRIADSIWLTDLASVMKRPTVSSSCARSWRMIFSATRRCTGSLCSAIQTVPNPP